MPIPLRNFMDMEIQLDRTDGQTAHIDIPTGTQSAEALMLATQEGWTVFPSSPEPIIDESGRPFLRYRLVRPAR